MIWPTIFPNFYFPLLSSVSWINTMLSLSSVLAGVPVFGWCLSLSPLKYSLIQRFLNFCLLHSKYRIHRETLSSASKLLAVSSMKIAGSPLMSMFGVTGRFSNSSSKYIRGQLLKKYSMFSNVPSDSLNVSRASLKAFDSADFINPIRRSKNPPHQGVCEKLNFHWILS